MPAVPWPWPGNSATRPARRMALIGARLRRYYAGDAEKALEWARQAQRIDPAAIPGWIARRCDVAMTAALIEAGEVAAAQRSCADGLARARQAGDLQDQADFLWLMAELDRRAGRMAEAGAHLREALEIAAQTGDRLRLIDCLDTCGHLCAATGRWAEAITVWAAYAAQSADMRACPICRRTRCAARNPCGRPRKRWDPPGRGRPRNAARR